jgi:hypothetical protein
MADDGRGNATADVDPDADSSRGLTSYVVAALRRLLVVIVVAAGLTALASLGLGLLAGASLTRSLSIGFYVVGSFWLVSGFFVGNRGPVRLKSDLGAPLFGSRFVRWATPEEREETINMSAIYVLLGFVLILFGFVADTRYSLF